MQALRRQGKNGFIEERLDVEMTRRGLTGPDRALCQELVFGMVRWQRTLDWLVARKTEGRTQNATLQVLLRLGLYQLFWLDRIPDHAAVNETVELAKELGFGPKAGFVNAILRAYIRERDQTARLLAELKETTPALGHSHPDWLVERWEKRWGREKTAKLLVWNNTPAGVFARVNTLKADAPTLAERWGKEGVEFHPRYFPWAGENLAFELGTHPPLASLPSFQEGFFYVQDPSTLLAPVELGAQPGETVLDLCAAPGGKTTFLAQMMGNRGRLAALEIDAGRLKLLEENCKRLGVSCAQFALAGASANAEPFDRVLIDAPCSNTGVLRRRIELRWRLAPEELERLRQVQLTLLRETADKIKPGGNLVYSTCSLEPEENGAVVTDFLAGRKDFRLVSERQLLPFEEQVDGAYVARLAKE